MARARIIYTLKQVAEMIGENLELLVTGRLLPRRFRLDASDEFFVVYKAVEEVVPFLR